MIPPQSHRHLLAALTRAVIAVSFAGVGGLNAQGNWVVDTRPVTVVGSGANDMQELSHVLGAGRLADGREMYYSNRATYPAKASDIQVDVPAGARLEILEASKGGYAMVVFDVATTYFCVVGVGAGVPPGWTDGQIHGSP